MARAGGWRGLLLLLLSVGGVGGERSEEKGLEAWCVCVFVCTCERLSFFGSSYSTNTILKSPTCARPREQP